MNNQNQKPAGNSTPNIILPIIIKKKAQKNMIKITQLLSPLRVISNRITETLLSNIKTRPFKTLCSKNITNPDSKKNLGSLN